MAARIQNESLCSCSLDQHVGWAAHLERMRDGEVKVICGIFMYYIIMVAYTRIVVQSGRQVSTFRKNRDGGGSSCLRNAELCI